LPDVPGLIWLEGAHPLPDARSVRAGTAVLEAVRGLTPDDLVLCLISGGASAMLSAPRGVTLVEKMALTDALLRSGADIVAMNAVRKHLSNLKGGRLAVHAQPAQVVSLIVSDVVGDDVGAIASGLTAPDPTTRLEAIDVLETHGIAVPDALRLEACETPKADHPAFQRVENHVVVSNRTALEAMQFSLETHGWRVAHVIEGVTGDARAAARDLAQLARNLPSGTAALTGGETTVVVRGDGRGGRNLELALQLVVEDVGVWALVVDSDGKDGSSDAAGAIVTPDSLARASSLGLDPFKFQRRNDAHGFFEALGDLVRTGPTGTNVNDLRMVLKPALKPD
jgi:glycerate-2-kinase